MLLVSIGDKVVDENSNDEDLCRTSSPLKHEQTQLFVTSECQELYFFFFFVNVDQMYFDTKHFHQDLNQPYLQYQFEIGRM